MNSGTWDLVKGFTTGTFFTTSTTWFGNSYNGKLAPWFEFDFLNILGYEYEIVPKFCGKYVNPNSPPPTTDNSSD